MIIRNGDKPGTIRTECRISDGILAENTKYLLFCAEVDHRCGIVIPTGHYFVIFRAKGHCQDSASMGRGCKVILAAQVPDGHATIFRAFHQPVPITAEANKIGCFGSPKWRADLPSGRVEHRDMTIFISNSQLPSIERLKCQTAHWL